MKKPTESDRAICPSCKRAWVDHPGLKQTCEERGDLQVENAQLRLLVAGAYNIPCIHCGLEDMNKCPKGFPGCAKADDIICGQDEALAAMRKERDELRQTIDALALNIKHSQSAVATLQQENSEAQSKVEELTALLREVEWSKDSLGCPVCQWTVRTHKYDCRLAKALKGERV